ncbi:MAG: hypothetical protein SF002_02770 [Alphaproteobacteria bacterium]|nr:hypothetical protein [Alphaproteobacteria bacterium]
MPNAPISRRLLLAAAGLAPLPLGAATLDGLAVTVQNSSEPVLCAEKDNVTLTVASPEIGSFSLEALHPAYIDTLQRDRFAPDWTACDMAGDPVHPAEPRRITLYEDWDLQLVGYTFPGFWRPGEVPLMIGERRETGLHMLQLWVRVDERAEEVLVLYPPDGYWRARPLPPRHLGWSAYGTSFLVGPVELLGRPTVRLTEVRFVPREKRFDLRFAAGGHGTVRLAELTRDRQLLTVALADTPGALPFAALRSMYITEVNADAARVAMRGPGARGWVEAPVMGFAGGEATDLWLGRHIPSRHNTSAPDMHLFQFRRW